MGDDNNNDHAASEATVEEKDRRKALRQFGRFVGVTAPSVALLLAAGSKPSQAQMTVSKPNPGPPVSSRQFKISEGAVDSSHALAAAMSGITTADAIDGVGLCLAAIKGLVQKIEGLESQLAML